MVDRTEHAYPNRLIRRHAPMAEVEITATRDGGPWWDLPWRAVARGPLGSAANSSYHASRRAAVRRAVKRYRRTYVTPGRRVVIRTRI